VVRHLAGYGRLSGLSAAGVLHGLYASARRYVNFFQPSFKLASKRRDGALVRKHYPAPLTPYQRLLASGRIDETIKQRLREQFAALDPVALLESIRAAQQQWLTFSNHDRHAAGIADQPEYLAARPRGTAITVLPRRGEKPPHGTGGKPALIPSRRVGHWWKPG
jgi:hypothetical protein